MTKVFNLYEAKNQLSSLVDRAASGEEIVIGKHGQPPMVKLVPVPRPRKGPRKPMNRLGVTYMADDFDAPWVLIPEAEVRHKKKGKGQ